MTDSDVDEFVDLPRPATRRRASHSLMLSARIFSGVVGTAAAIGLITAASWLPLPAHTITVPSVLVTPAEATQQRVCAGPLLRLGSESGDSASIASSLGNPVVQFGSTSGRVGAKPLLRTDNSSGATPRLLTLGGASSGTLFAGSQSQVVTRIDSVGGDVAGLAVSECVAGSGDSWLVGGATATGRTTIVTLSNPTDVSATAVLTIYSETGQVASAGTEGIVVAPGADRTISLAAFAPGANSTVVRVHSRGGSIVANLQQSTIRTLEPGGIDIVDAAAQPATTTVIPGVVIAGSDAVFAQQGAVGFSDLISVVRLLAPGTVATHAQISVIPEGSTAQLSPPARVTLKPGIVTDVPLGSFPDGNYTIIVTSDQQLVGGVRGSTVDSAGQSDFAWMGAAQAIHGKAIVVVAPGPAPLAHFANTSDRPVVVTMTATSGNVTSVTVPSRGAVAAPVTAGTTYVLGSTGPFEAAVSYVGDGLLAGFSVSPPTLTSQPIRVYR